MTQLTICNIEISTDANGLYRLNDLHKASGGETRNEPGQWLRHQKTQDFIKVCETETMRKCVVSTVGRNGGTYISKKLVYHYAMWVSPEFASRVIETFDALMTGKLQTPEPISKDDLLDQLYLQYVAEREATKHLANKVEAQQPAVEFVQKMANSNGTMELDDFCKAYNKKPSLTKQRLLDLGYLIQKKKRPYQASSKSLDSGLMAVKTTSGGRSYVVVTPKGALKLREALDRNTLYVCDDVITYPTKLKD